MMSIRFTTGKICALAVVAASLCLGASAIAQPPAAGGGGGGGQRRQGGRGFQPTLASLPVAVLADGLKLTAAQKSKVQAIHDQYTKDMQDLRPQQGQQVDRQEMFQKMQALNEKTNASIGGVLTAEQNKQAPAFLKSVSGYRMVGIPLEVLPDLKLTADQKSKISAISDAAQKQFEDMRNNNNGGQGGFQQFQEMAKANHDKAEAVLTSTQKATLDKYIADHPQRGFGGGRRGGGGGQPAGNGPV